MTDYEKSWMKFLDSNEVRFQLLSSGMYLTVYEIFTECVVGKIKDFYTIGLDENGVVLRDEYRAEVRGLNRRDIVLASGQWLENHGVISEEEKLKIGNYKVHRNDLAHELPKYISDVTFNVIDDYFGEIRELYFKIQSWWYLEVELTTNDMIDLDNIDQDNLDMNEVLSLVMFTIDHIILIYKEELEKIELIRNERK